MIMKKLIALLAVLICSPALAAYNQYNGVLPAANGGTGANAIGTTMSNANNILNTTQPIREVSAGTDTITTSDAGGYILYNNGSSAIAVALASPSTAGYNYGFGFSVHNSGTGSVTFTPAAGLINQAATFVLPPQGDCSIISDGTNYQLGACTSLLLSTLSSNSRYRVIGITIDGAGSVITPGPYGFYTAPFSGNITGWSIASNISGSAVVDVWKRNAAIPTVSNTITASALPTLSSSQYINSTTLTGWTTSVAQGDVIGFNVNSDSTATRLTVQLYVTTN